MVQGTFFFIVDAFFTKYDPEHRLMKNKENGHGRPCFYAFPDNKDPSILWCVPISSQVQKFKTIVQHKLALQAAKGVETPRCDTIRFGHVMGQERAFLVQNMFPVTASYIDNVYIDRNTQNPVTIPPAEERDISKSAKDVLKLVFRGNANLVFADIVAIYNGLKAEMAQQQAEAEEPAEEEPEQEEPER